MAVVAVSRSDKLFGISLHQDPEVEIIDPVTYNDDGTTVVNTTVLTKNIIGYVGTVPVDIIIKDGKIEKIKPLENNETPEYWGAIMNSDLLESYYGKTLDEALKFHADAVSGATYSSSALIKNIEAGIAYAHNMAPLNEHSIKPQFDLKFFVTLLVILCASVLPLFIRNNKYRIIQLIINVLVLGFWGGTFLSYTFMTSIMANGITNWLILPMLLMLITAFVYPFWGKKNYYCTWICPYGSIQELAGRCVPFKIKISQKTSKILMFIRDVLWVALMFVMMIGLWFDWMNWEPFSAFFFRDASVVTLCIAGGFLLLSLIIQRPYCRFVCPTGTLFKISEGNK